MSAASKALLSVLSFSNDKLSLVIRNGAKVPESLSKLKHFELGEALNELKIDMTPDKNTVDVIRNAARVGEHKGEDFEVCRGTPPQGPQPGRWEWIVSLRRPEDHAVQDEPVIRIVPPEGPRPGVNLVGEEIPAKVEPTPEPITLNLGPGLELQHDGTVVARASGQVKVQGQDVTLEPVYVVNVAHSPQYAVCEFYSDVHVLSDLIGNMKWRVFGKLEVEGHWQAADIEVFGDVQAKGGIQTNMIGTLRFWNNCQTTYIQFSQLGVFGNLTVENSVQLSELRVGGHLVCTSNPGAILGSTIYVYDSIRANKVGSENGQRTRIMLMSHDDVRTSRIEKLLQGTVISYRGDSYTAATDTSFDSSQPPSAIAGEAPSAASEKSPD